MADIPQVLATYDGLVGVALGALNRVTRPAGRRRCRDLIRHGSAVSIALPAEPSPLRPTPDAAGRRYQFTLALRELDRREPIRVLLADGSGCDGTIEAVGSDYLETAEHHLGEARRRDAVRARRFIGFAAVVAVTIPQASR